MDPENDSYFNVSKAQEFASLGRTSIYRAMKKGKLAYIKIGRKLLFAKADLIAFLEKHKTKAKG